jgi:hypothetical protein
MNLSFDREFTGIVGFRKLLAIGGRPLRRGKTTEAVRFLKV